MEFIEVAKIVNSHGIKGSVKIYLLTNDFKRFKENSNFYIDKKIKVTVKSVKSLNKDYAIITFNEYDNINDILNFKNLSIFVDEKDVKILPKDEFYIYKLIGVNVYNQDDVFIGRVKDVLQTLANDVYQIDYNGKDIYIPAVKEFIKAIDIENSFMKVNFIKGMLDD